MDSEATPLPDDATVRAGLFHERFAQMQGHWEDWRKKKTSKRHYAMCANEQDTGVRFKLQGGVKQLPQVRMNPRQCGGSGIQKGSDRDR